MASRVQKIMFWDTLKNAKSVILHFFPVAEIGRNIHLLYFSYLQEIYSQFVEWEKNVLSPYSPQWSVHFSVSLLLITRKHPVDIHATAKTNIIVFSFEHINIVRYNFWLWQLFTTMRYCNCKFVVWMFLFKVSIEDSCFTIIMRQQ